MKGISITLIFSILISNTAFAKVDFSQILNLLPKDIHEMIGDDYKKIVKGLSPVMISFISSVQLIIYLYLFVHLSLESTFYL